MTPAEPQLLPVPAVVDQRFAVYYRPNTLERDGLLPDLFDYQLHDRLTGAVHSTRSLEGCLVRVSAIAAREAEIDWARIAAVDFFISPISVAPVEVWAHGEDGERLRDESGQLWAPIVRVRFDREANIVMAYVDHWLRALGQEPRPRAEAMLREREARVEAQATTTVVPGKRRRLSPLAGRQLAAV